jgi:hypothetical protein
MCMVHTFKIELVVHVEWMYKSQQAYTFKFVYIWRKNLLMWQWIFKPDKRIIIIIEQEVSITAYNAFCLLNVSTYKYADRLAKLIN